MTINKIGVSLLISTILSTVVVMASAVGITFYAFAAGSSVELHNVFAVAVERDGAFSVTFGAGIFLTGAIMIALSTLAIGLFQMMAAKRGGR